MLTIHFSEILPYTIPNTHSSTGGNGDGPGPVLALLETRDLRSQCGRGPATNGSGWFNGKSQTEMDDNWRYIPRHP